MYYYKKKYLEDSRLTKSCQSLGFNIVHQNSKRVLQIYGLHKKRVLKFRRIPLLQTFYQNTLWSQEKWTVGRNLISFLYHILECNFCCCYNDIIYNATLSYTSASGGRRHNITVCIYIRMYIGIYTEIKDDNTYYIIHDVFFKPLNALLLYRRTKRAAAREKKENILVRYKLINQKNK